MTRWHRRLALVAVVILVVAFSGRGLADEGFWLFNAPPRAAMSRALGFEPTDAWLSRLQRSAVRFGGASGSFVSPDGLILTNHHVGLRTIQRLSTPERDLVQNGFYAATLADELRAPGLALDVLMAIEDVTAEIDAAEKPGMTPADAFAARQSAMTRLEQASHSATGLKSEVVTLYQGALYHLYRYRTYDDVRLVFAPEFDVAFYGGDTDNFTYPRYCLDVCFFRVYEDGKPARVSDYLPWSLEGVRDGDAVFAAGHPGATQRLNTVAHLEYLRDVGIPWVLGTNERRHAALTRYAATGAEAARQAKDEVFGIENSIKSQRGQMGGLRDAGLMEKKRRAESRLTGAVAADAAMRARYGGAWDAVAKARQTYASFSKDYSFSEGAYGFNTRYFALARSIVRLAAERLRADGERLPEFTESRLASLERTLYSPAPIYPDLERAKLADSLAYMAETLGATHPLVTQVAAALPRSEAPGGRSPADVAATLVLGTRLGDVSARKALAALSPAELGASGDTMIVLAQAVDAESRRQRKRYEDEVVGVERDAYAKIARAVFAIDGPAAYPDATSTLRLAYGHVRGYREDGRAVPPFTDFAGLYARAAAHQSEPPYQIVDRWVARKDALPLDTPFNFVSTLDIVGGNSGSPVVNRAGQVVGVIFDGNIQSLPGYFIYDPSVNRAVSVDARGILEALRAAYGADRLVAEITAGARTTQP